MLAVPLPQILQDAQPVRLLVERPLKMFKIGDILPDFVPKLLFVELFLQENEKICRHIFAIELRQLSVGICDAVEVRVVIDGIAFPVALHCGSF